MSSQLAPPQGGSTIDVSDLALPLASGKGWIKFLAIVQIVFASLYVLISFGLGLIVMWLPIWLSVLLLQATGGLERAQMQGDAAAFKIALGKLKLYFMIQAIAMIVGLALGILGGILAVVLGMNMGNLGMPH